MCVSFEQISCVRCLTFPVLCLSFSHLRSPIVFVFLKAIRHCRICQLRSSKRFWEIASKALQKYLILFYLSSPLSCRCSPSKSSSHHLSCFSNLILSIDFVGRFSSSSFLLFCPTGKAQIRPSRALSVPPPLSRFSSHCDVVTKATYHAPVHATKQWRRKDSIVLRKIPLLFLSWFDIVSFFSLFLFSDVI